MQYTTKGLAVLIVAAGVACGGNEQMGEAQRITGERLTETIARDDVFYLDVRRPDELTQLGTVEGYTNIPIEELEQRLGELPRDRPILTA